MKNDVFITGTSSYFPNNPVSNEDMEDFLGLIAGKHSRVKPIILTYIIHSGFISGYQNRYGDNLKPPTNVYHRMTA